MRVNQTGCTTLLLFFAIAIPAVVAVGFSPDTVADDLVSTHVARGTHLSKEDAYKLEQDLKSNPGSFADRIELLAYYSFKLYRERLTPEEITNRREHILWVIEHQS